MRDELYHKKEKNQENFIYLFIYLFLSLCFTKKKFLQNCLKKKNNVLRFSPNLSFPFKKKLDIKDPHVKFHGWKIFWKKTFSGPFFLWHPEWFKKKIFRLFFSGKISFCETEWKKHFRRILILLLFFNQRNKVPAKRCFWTQCHDFSFFSFYKKLKKEKKESCLWKMFLGNQMKKKTFQVKIYFFFRRIFFSSQQNLLLKVF